MGAQSNAEIALNDWVGMAPPDRAFVYLSTVCMLIMVISAEPQAPEVDFIAKEGLVSPFYTDDQGLIRPASARRTPGLSRRNKSPSVPSQIRSKSDGIIQAMITSPPMVPVSAPTLRTLRAAAEVAKQNAALAMHNEGNKMETQRKERAARILKQAVRVASGNKVTHVRRVHKPLQAYTSSFQHWYADVRADDLHAEATLNKLKKETDHDLEEQADEQSVWANDITLGHADPHPDEINPEASEFTGKIVETRRLHSKSKITKPKSKAAAKWK